MRRSLFIVVMLISEAVAQPSAPAPVVKPGAPAPVVKPGIDISKLQVIKVGSKPAPAITPKIKMPTRTTALRTVAPLSAEVKAHLRQAFAKALGTKPASLIEPIHATVLAPGKTVRLSLSQMVVNGPDGQVAVEMSGNPTSVWRNTMGFTFDDTSGPGLIFDVVVRGGAPSAFLLACSMETLYYGDDIRRFIPNVRINAEQRSVPITYEQNVPYGGPAQFLIAFASPGGSYRIVIPLGINYALWIDQCELSRWY